MIENACLFVSFYSRAKFVRCVWGKPTARDVAFLEIHDRNTYWNLCSMIFKTGSHCRKKDLAFVYQWSAKLRCFRLPYITDSMHLHVLLIACPHGEDSCRHYHYLHYDTHAMRINYSTCTYFTEQKLPKMVIVYSTMIVFWKNTYISEQINKPFKHMNNLLRLWRNINLPCMFCLQDSTIFVTHLRHFNIHISIRRHLNLCTKAYSRTRTN